MTLLGVRFEFAPVNSMGVDYSIDVLGGMSASQLAFMFVS